MTLLVTTPDAPNDIDGLLSAWLDEICSKRDFSVRCNLPVLDGPEAARFDAVRRLVRTGASELARFDALVDEAGNAVERNAEQLANARGSAERYRALVLSASKLLEQMRGLSENAASEARQLEETSGFAIESAASAAGYLHATDNEAEGTQALVTAIGLVDTASTDLRKTARGLLAFVNGVARIARQAALLSTNALIEAAHLGQAGKGFAIVANEVRTLAESTKQAVQDVGQIARRLAEATERASSSTSQAYAASRELAGAEHRIIESVDAIQGMVRGFSQPVQSIAAMATQHQGAIPEVVASFEGITATANGVASAAQEASDVDLATQFDRVRRLIAAYRLTVDTEESQPTHTSDPMARAIRSVATGEEDAIRGFDGTLANSVNAFAEALAASEREILETIMHGAVAVARNSYLWLAIAARIRELKAALETTLQMLGESRDASRALVESSRSMQDLAHELRLQTDAAVQTLNQSVGSLDRVRANVAQVGTVVGDMTAALDRAGTILALVDEISAETNLLALNAAIEAAHAGEAGLGFSVIATEIRKLADSTHIATNEVGRTIDQIAEAGHTIRDGMTTSTDLTHTVEERAVAAQRSVVQLVARMNDAVDRSLSLASMAEQQMQAYDRLIGEIDTTLDTIDASVAAATDVRRLELAEVGHRAFALVGGRRLGIFAERMRNWGFELAAEMDAVFDAAVDSGAINVNDCRDTDYQLIDGKRIIELARLFDVSRVPESGFNPPKFSTRYDRAVENGINAIIDNYVPNDPAIKAMFAVDLNGYCFGHYKECRHDWTGDYKTDLNQNRIKRFFEDALSLRCSRIGLGERAHAFPGRTPYAQFMEAGCELRRPPGRRPWAIYTYARDTGLVYNDLSLALFVKNQRVGTIRIIYDPDTL